MAADEINEITGLYPYIQKYFDVYNNFCCHGIPSCENDPITLDNSFLKSVITESGESADYDIENIRNVTEVLGSVYDIDRMATECTMSGNTYRLQLTEYDKYVSNDYIAFIPNADSLDGMQLQINGLSPVPIYYENTTTPVAKGTMHKDETYVLLYKKWIPQAVFTILANISLTPYACLRHPRTILYIPNSILQNATTAKILYSAWSRITPSRFSR